MSAELTPHESLRLIEGMIGQARRSFSRFSFYFLLWGVLLIGAMIAAFLLRESAQGWQFGAPWGVAGVLGGIVSGIHGARESRREQVINPMDSTIGWLWGSFVITMLLLIAFTVIGRADTTVAITMLTGLPTFLTGQILRFKPLKYGGVLFWLAGVAMMLLSSALATLVLYCTAMALGYILPGLLLKRHEDGLRTA